MHSARALAVALLWFGTSRGAFAQQHRNTSLSNGETPEIETIATTYRIGAIQYAVAVVSVRTLEDRQHEIAVEVLDCRITQPIKGDLSTGRRTYETSCSASWQIASDSDASMKDFEVTSSASSGDVGDMHSVQVFKFGEMNGSRSKSATTQGTKKMIKAKKAP